MKSLYRKTNVDICSAKSMHDFLRNHFTYYTMNSWNGLKSIANNVKVYNLNLEGDQWKALERLEITDYSVVNDLIDSWENDHPEVKIGFNGRSGGYIVLYRDEGFSDVLPECIADYDYEDFKRYCRDYYGSVKNYMSELRYYTQLVRDFDELCDDIRDYVNELSKIPDEEWECQYE